MPDNLTFNGHGLLNPGFLDCTLACIEDALLFTEHRIQLWADFKQAIELIKAAGFDFDLYIDGSFVTDKQLPNDIELILDVRNKSSQDQLAAIMFHMRNHNTLKQSYRVDCYPNLGVGSNDFCSFFQYVGEKTAIVKGLSSKDLKGIIRVIS